MTDHVWNLLLLLAGGGLTVLGGWLTDLRGERRRKSAKLEESYLAWLNSEASVIGRLKQVVGMAAREPKSSQEHDLLVTAFEGLRGELKNLAAALNMALVYERKKEKKRLVELQAEKLRLITDTLDQIIQHHAIHQELREHIVSSEMMLERAGKVVEQADALATREDVVDAVGAAPKIAALKEAALAEQEAVRSLREDSREHLQRCGNKLSADAARLASDIKMIEERTPELRKLLVE